MEQLLIVEDDRGLNQGLCRALRREGRTLVSCQNLKGAREQLQCGGVSLVLLDINLPDGSGLTLLQELQATMPALPVILLSANDTDPDIVEGLELGAEDYITKPFSLSVLRARVDARLRKAGREQEQAIWIDGFCFDFAQLRVSRDGKEILLSRSELRLLQLLVENRGRVLERRQLMDRIWTDGAEYVDENALSVTVKRLRDKLGASEYIKTVYGIGYSWINKDEMR